MIDDSLSMKEHGLGFFALESVVAILQSLDILEISEVCVGAMRERLKIVHSFNEKYTRQKAGFIISSFNFDYNEINSADYVPASFSHFPIVDGELCERREPHARTAEVRLADHLHHTVGRKVQQGKRAAVPGRGCGQGLHLRDDHPGQLRYLYPKI